MEDSTQIFIIIFTSTIPFWLFMYHPISSLPWVDQVQYHLTSYPFYLWHYFFMYVFVVDFILSAVCNSQNNLFCDNNYNMVKYTSLYIAIGILVLTTISQVINVLNNTYIVKEAEKMRKRRRIRQSVMREHKFIGNPMLSRREKEKKIRKSVLRREDLDNQDEEKYEQIQNAIEKIKININNYTPLKYIYNGIDQLQSTEKKQKLETLLGYALLHRISNSNLSQSQKKKIRKLLYGYRDTLNKKYLLQLLNIQIIV